MWPTTSQSLTVCMRSDIGHIQSIRYRRVSPEDLDETGEQKYTRNHVHCLSHTSKSERCRGQVDSIRHLKASLHKMALHCTLSNPRTLACLVVPSQWSNTNKKQSQSLSRPTTRTRSMFGKYFLAKYVQSLCPRHQTDNPRHHSVYSNLPRMPPPPTPHNTSKQFNP